MHFPADVPSAGNDLLPGDFIMSFPDWILASPFDPVNIALSALAGLVFGILTAKIFERQIHEVNSKLLLLLTILSPLIGVNTSLLKIDEVIIHFNVFLFMSVVSFSSIKFVLFHAKRI